MFEVTRATLEQLVKNFRSARSAGNRIPWIWNHDGKAQDRIGDLVDLQIRGQTLVGQLQVLDESAKLSFGNQPGELTFQEVSIEITEHWVDGKGNQYPLAITHVANVLNPVVPNQKPFRRVFANSAVVGNTPSADPQTSEQTELARLVRRLNRMFNTQLPESVKSLRELNARLLLGPTNGADGKVAARSTPTQQFQLDDAGRQAKYQFAQAIDKLIVDNRLTPAEGKELMRTANQYQIYELALLKPYQRLGSAMPNYSIEQLLASEHHSLWTSRFISHALTTITRSARRLACNRMPQVILSTPCNQPSAIPCYTNIPQ